MYVLVVVVVFLLGLVSLKVPGIPPLAIVVLDNLARVFRCRSECIGAYRVESRIRTAAACILGSLPNFILLWQL